MEYEHGHDDQPTTDAQQPCEYPGDGSHNQIQCDDFQHDDFPPERGNAYLLVKFV